MPLTFSFVMLFPPLLYLYLSRPAYRDYMIGGTALDDKGNFIEKPYFYR